MLASVACLTTRENGGVKGASDVTPHLYSSQAQEQEERMAACRRLVTPHVPQLFGPGKNENSTRVAGAQRSISPVAAVLQCAPCLPSPIFSIFSSVRSRWGAGQQQSFLLELCAVRGLLSAAVVFLLVVSGLSEYKAK